MNTASIIITNPKSAPLFLRNRLQAAARNDGLVDMRAIACCKYIGIGRNSLFYAPTLPLIMACLSQEPGQNCIQYMQRLEKNEEWQ